MLNQFTFALTFEVSLYYSKLIISRKKAVKERENALSLCLQNYESDSLRK